VAELATLARRNVEDTGFSERVTVINGDGSIGYREKAPYDRILGTAAAPQVPPPLIGQLSVGGIMVLPIGSAYMFQTLMRFRKTLDGRVTKEDLGGVAFVPLTGRYGQNF
jgi:protein-L-isoaspartate(D-aspartate) O-methyltransferase